MAKPISLNLIDTFLAAMPEEKLTEGKTFHWKWIKRITGLNKSDDTGYSLLGKWVTKENQLSWQRPGLYFIYAYEWINLPKADGSDHRVRAHLVSIFDLDSEGIAHLLHSDVYEKGDYAVQCWGIIDQWLLAHTKPKPLPSIQEEQAEISELLESPPLTVSAVLTAASPPVPEIPIDANSTSKTPLRDLIIRYAIEAQFNRSVRAMPRESVDITPVATKQFSWGTEYLFDIYRLDLSRELGVDWRSLPSVEIRGEWLEFHFSEDLES